MSESERTLRGRVYVELACSRREQLSFLPLAWHFTNVPLSKGEMLSTVMGLALAEKATRATARAMVLARATPHLPLLGWLRQVSGARLV